MKKVLLLLIVTSAISSCAPVYRESIASIVYTEYTGNNFRVTPFEYASQDFEVIGSIMNEFEVGKPTNESDKDKVIERAMPKSRSIEYDIKFDYMFKKTIESAKAIGANGIMKFDWQRKTDKTGMTSYFFTGVAVKFKD